MLRVLVIAVMLIRGFQPLHLGAALVAMFSLASEVWTLLFDDSSSMIFRQSTVGPYRCDMQPYTHVQKLTHVTHNHTHKHRQKERVKKTHALLGGKHGRRRQSAEKAEKPRWRRKPCDGFSASTTKTGGRDRVHQRTTEKDDGHDRRLVCETIRRGKRHINTAYTPCINTPTS